MKAVNFQNDDIAQVAWLYYVGNLSQQEVSDRLGISRFKVIRMLADARELGMVRISVEHRTSKTLNLADLLMKKFSLKEVQVAPVPLDPDDYIYARSAVGILAASYLARIAGGDQVFTIGLGWGRTLSAMADNIVGLKNKNLTFVSIMGTVTHATHTAPVDVCVRLASQTGGRAMLMPAPFVADDAMSCKLIMEQRLVRETMEVARSASHVIMSVGECHEGAILFDSGLFSDEQLEELQANDIVADCCGVFFRKDGSIADIALNQCTPCVKPNEMTDMDVSITAGGATKLLATLAVLRAGFVDRLFVDEILAQALLKEVF